MNPLSEAGAGAGADVVSAENPPLSAADVSTPYTGGAGAGVGAGAEEVSTSRGTTEGKLLFIFTVYKGWCRGVFFI